MSPVYVVGKHPNNPGKQASCVADLRQILSNDGDSFRHYLLDK